MPMVVPLTMPSLRWPSSGPRAEHKADNRALAEKLDRLDAEEGFDVDGGSRVRQDPVP